MPTDDKPPLTIADYEEVLADHRRLIRELDGILSGGPEHAAKQASLCDLVPFVKRVMTEHGLYKTILEAIANICNEVKSPDPTARCVLILVNKALNPPLPPERITTTFNSPPPSPPRFPMQDGPSIDMVAARAIYQVYSCMHSGQSLAEIARRGGFAWMEVGHLLEKHAEYKQRGNCTCPKT